MPFLYQERKHPESTRNADPMTLGIPSGVKIVCEQASFSFKSDGDARGFAVIENQAHVG
jgi:hypothetical protein